MEQKHMTLKYKQFHPTINRLNDILMPVMSLQKRQVLKLAPHNEKKTTYGRNISLPIVQLSSDISKRHLREKCQ